MEKNILILASIVAFVILIIIVVYMNNKSQQGLAKYSLMNNAIIYKNTELQNKANTKDYLNAITGVASSVASIYSSSNSGN